MVWPCANRHQSAPLSIGRVTYDGEIVSEKRTIKSTTTHDFGVKNSDGGIDQFFVVAKQNLGVFSVQVFKDGELFDGKPEVDEASLPVPDWGTQVVGAEEDWEQDVAENVAANGEAPGGWFHVGAWWYHSTAVVILFAAYRGLNRGGSEITAKNFPWLGVAAVLAGT